MNELRAGDPVVAAEVTLLPIEHCVIESCSGDEGCWLSAQKEPFAIIVFDTNGVRAFDTQAAEVTIESLIQQVPNLGAKLAARSS